ncbi:tryptophan dimethylallyltransferase family protein [Streptomyces sp. SCSIO 75703]|uniref:tryptophan dimethylallyltransferase family protein n=1 Tax=unclassified Streptomyces TaxID=2593676 RepID=UPI0005632AAA|nr:MULTISPECIES: tryptophan dimethylallyltransferase family protein [unclassified Streptomyces]
MTAAPVRADLPAATLTEHTTGQLRRLAALAGLSEADTATYADVLTEALGPVGARSLDLPPPDRTFLSDDHTPVEFSLSLQPGTAPSLRVLLEPGCGADGLDRNGRIGLAAIRAMARRWNFSTGPLDAVRDLFLPPSPQGPLALWCALELRPGGVPRVKVYLNPAALRVKRSFWTVREAMERLGHGRAFASLARADGYPFVALDLGDWEEPRLKVYARHDDLTAGRAGRLSRMDPGPDAAAVEDFFLTAAGGGREVTRLSRRPGLTCHAFTETGAARPSGFTLHIPVRDYARHDGEVLERAGRVLARYGMDTAVLPRALSAVTGRRPEDGVGLIAYLALAHQHGRAPRVTAYLSSEAYAVRPPALARPRHVNAVR